MTESQYQAALIKKIKALLPGCVVLKNDSSYQQGILDLTILYFEKWAALEVKATPQSARQPNQEYFVQQLDEMSFAAFIDPENEGEVLDALQEALQPSGRPCVPQS